MLKEKNSKSVGSVPCSLVICEVEAKHMQEWHGHERWEESHCTPIPSRPYCLCKNGKWLKSERIRMGIRKTDRRFPRVLWFPQKMEGQLHCWAGQLSVWEPWFEHVRRRKEVQFMNLSTTQTWKLHAKVRMGRAIAFMFSFLPCNSQCFGSWCFFILWHACLQEWLLVQIMQKPKRGSSEVGGTAGREKEGRGGKGRSPVNNSIMFSSPHDMSLSNWLKQTNSL